MWCTQGNLLVDHWYSFRNHLRSDHEQFLFFNSTKIADSQGKILLWRIWPCIYRWWSQWDIILTLTFFQSSLIWTISQTLTAYHCNTVNRLQFLSSFIYLIQYLLYAVVFMSFTFKCVTYLSSWLHQSLIFINHSSKSIHYKKKDHR